MERFLTGFLATLKGLQSLHLSGTQITDEGVKAAWSEVLAFIAARTP